jgi:hypothetical protein
VLQPDKKSRPPACIAVMGWWCQAFKKSVTATSPFGDRISFDYAVQTALLNSLNVKGRRIMGKLSLTHTDTCCFNVFKRRLTCRRAEFLNKNHAMPMYGAWWYRCTRS